MLYEISILYFFTLIIDIYSLSIIVSFHTPPLIYCVMIMTTFLPSTIGFHGILKTIDRDGLFLEEIKAAIKSNGAKRVIFSGYSLGGAVASLALLQHGDALLAEGIDVRAITFGCPRLADNKDLHKLPKRLTTKIIHTYIEGTTDYSYPNSIMTFTRY